MTRRLAEPLQVWRSRHARTAGDRAYVAYMIIMVMLVLVAPPVRAVAVSATSAEAAAALASPGAASVAALATASIWALFLVLGRVRGPALRPLFVTYALASSDLPRTVTFRGPLLRAGAIVVALTSTVGVVVSAGLGAAGHGEAVAALLFVVASACVGIVSCLAWLAGQALPRTAAVLAPLVLALGIATSTIPTMHPFTPWGWVALAYPVAPATGALAPLLVLTVAAVSLVPALMSRLTLPLLTAHAARWEITTAHATGMELAAAATVYRPTPTLGRRLRAVRPALRRPLLFLRRDAIGAARTPLRLATALLGLAGAAALSALAVAPESPGWALGAAAGVALFATVGPLTDGIRHAASVASDLALYGISDERLLAYHTLFPVIVTIIVVTLVASMVTVLFGLAVPAVLGSALLATLAILARIATALKRPLPPALLTPIPTPLGDLGAAVRLAWATDGIALTAVAGASIALLPQQPVLLLAVGIALGGLTAQRWRRRF